MWLSLYILGMYSTIPIVNIINHCAKSSEANTANLIRMQREREIEREEKKVRKRDTGRGKRGDNKGQSSRKKRRERTIEMEEFRKYELCGKTVKEIILYKQFLSIKNIFSNMFRYFTEKRLNLYIINQFC